MDEPRIPVGAIAYVSFTWVIIRETILPHQFRLWILLSILYLLFRAAPTAMKPVLDSWAMFILFLFFLGIIWNMLGRFIAADVSSAMTWVVS
jgi:predicted membrane protein